MRPGLPQSHVEEAMKLEARGLVELFRIDLKAPGNTILTLRICPQKELTWQGTTWYADTPCSVSDSSLNVSGETSRPKFTIVNPEGVWSRYIHQKYSDNAIVTRYRVLRPHIDSNSNISQMSAWRISKTLSLSKNLAVFEMRTALDGHNFKIPRDTYRPPNYPTVSVSG